MGVLLTHTHAHAHAHAHAHIHSQSRRHTQIQAHTDYQMTHTPTHTHTRNWTFISKPSRTRSRTHEDTHKDTTQMHTCILTQTWKIKGSIILKYDLLHEPNHNTHNHIRTHTHTHTHHQLYLWLICAVSRWRREFVLQGLRCQWRAGREGCCIPQGAVLVLHVLGSEDGLPVCPLQCSAAGSTLQFAPPAHISI